MFVFSVIFELANQRQELWDKMLELESRANDRNRLFHNRGGQLLLEEKERKNIQKVI
jgi:protein regulator of cytokinesis 1